MYDSESFVAGKPRAYCPGPLLTSTVLPSQSVEAASIASRAGVWLALVEQVRSWRPDVVVLVARKMPRLAQALDLDFGAPTLTDLAIPFADGAFVGARVAVVDDVVNVGSTFAAARASVVERGAAEVALFAIGFRSFGDSMLSADEVHCVSPDQLGRGRTSSLSADIPQLLRGLARPYDLDFPVLECAAQPPFSDLREVSRGLADCFGPSETRDVTSWEGRRSGVCRMSIEIAGPNGWLAKLRLYGSPVSPRFWLVPMAVPPAISQPMLPLDDSLWQQLTHALPPALRNGEPGARAALFAYSLAFGLNCVDKAGSVLQLVNPAEVFDRREASIAFGPIAKRLTVPDEAGGRTDPAGQSVTSNLASPFLSYALDFDFPAKLADMAGCGDPGQLFESLFRVLSDCVGADDPGRYRFAGPYTPQEIADQPYRRLRVGPTWTDLTLLIRRAASLIDGEQGVVRCSDLELSTLLDRYIDGGSVVPTFAQYGDCFYRIYRKGETDPHEEIAERVGYAWAAYGKPLSLTRATKILTVLGLAPDSEVPISVSAFRRGNVACMPRSMLDESAEMARYLRDTGRLRASREPDASGPADE